MRKTDNITGQTFGRLTVIKMEIRGDKRRRTLCLCVCSCPPKTQRWITPSQLKSGETRSCGCLAAELSHRRATKHGQYRSVEWNAWISMKRRCHWTKDFSFSRYGGRGISVCTAWRYSFERFYVDMGPKPGPKYSVDRINNDGNYSCGKCEQCLHNGWPANCRWADIKTQARNMSTNVLISYGGETKTLVEWSEESPVSYGTFHMRIRSGWSFEKALKSPLLRKRTRKTTLDL